MTDFIWKLYHEDGRLRTLTVENLEGVYIEISEGLALEFQQGVKRFVDYLIYNNKLIDKPKESTGLILMPELAKKSSENIYDTLELDPSWLADSSINSISKYELKWQK